jgi:hypothetical protein
LTGVPINTSLSTPNPVTAADFFVSPTATAAAAAVAAKDDDTDVDDVTDSARDGGVHDTEMGAGAVDLWTATPTTRLPTLLILLRASPTAVSEDKDNRTRWLVTEGRDGVDGTGGVGSSDGCGCGGGDVGSSSGICGGGGEMEESWVGCRVNVVGLAVGDVGESDGAGRFDFLVTDAAETFEVLIVRDLCGINMGRMNWGVV